MNYPTAYDRLRIATAHCDKAMLFCVRGNRAVARMCAKDAQRQINQAVKLLSRKAKA